MDSPPFYLCNFDCIFFLILYLCENVFYFTKFSRHAYSLHLIMIHSSYHLCPSLHTFNFGEKYPWKFSSSENTHHLFLFFASSVLIFFLTSLLYYSSPFLLASHLFSLTHISYLLPCLPYPPLKLLP